MGDREAGRNLGRNLKELRKARGLSLADLSGRLDQAGYPMALNVLSKTERGTRTVSVDDLVALAVVLDVSPNRLLFGGDAGGDEVRLVPTVAVTAGVAWRWAAGLDPLPPHADDVDRAARFAVENQPYDPPDATSLAMLNEHADVLVDAARAVRAAQQAGLSARAVLEAVELLVKIDDPDAGTTGKYQRGAGLIAIRTPGEEA